MNNDYGFEARKAYVDRARDERVLNALQKHNMPTTKLARNQNAMKKHARFDNTVRLSGIKKENFMGFK